MTDVHRNAFSHGDWWFLEFKTFKRCPERPIRRPSAIKLLRTGCAKLLFILFELPIKAAVTNVVELKKNKKELAQLGLSAQFKNISIIVWPSFLQYQNIWRNVSAVSHLQSQKEGKNGRSLLKGCYRHFLSANTGNIGEQFVKLM